MSLVTHISGIADVLKCLQPSVTGTYEQKTDSVALWDPDYSFWKLWRCTSRSCELQRSKERMIPSQEKQDEEICIFLVQADNEAQWG